jgi:hypothetical protein
MASRPEKARLYMQLFIAWGSKPQNPYGKKRPKKARPKPVSGAFDGCERVLKDSAQLIVEP